MISVPEFFTIGVYGYSPETFFEALATSGIDTFCDIRLRRGVRGSEYAFANSTRLQNELTERSIRYLHILALAPPIEIRKAQYAVDKETHTAKRQRTELSDAFKDAYRYAVLSSFDSTAFLEELSPDAKRVVLFCVERDAAACHRSLVAERLEQDLGVTVTHLAP